MKCASCGATFGEIPACLCLHSPPIGGMARTRRSSESEEEEETQVLRVEASLRRRAVLNTFIGLIVLAAAAATGFAVVRPALKEREAAETQLAAAKALVAAKKAEAARLGRQVTLLETDPEYLGLYAREKFEVAKDGETVMKPESTPPPPKTGSGDK